MEADMSELFHSAFEQTGFELKPQNPRIKAVLKYIDEHIHEDITMENLMEVGLGGLYGEIEKIKREKS